MHENSPGQPKDASDILNEAAPPTTGQAGQHASKRQVTGRVLVVDDDQDACDLMESILGKHFEVATRTSGAQALELVADKDFDVILTDLSMEGMTGIELCERILGTRPDVPVVVVTGHGSMESAIAAIRVGAYDFITKPVDSKLLSLSVSRAIQHSQLNEEVSRLRRAVSDTQRFSEIIGASAAMRKVFDLVGRVAESDASVLITGDSGTGKELVARAVHQHSPRRDGPFMAINCAAVPHTLLESELFGHMKGAFTDAKVNRMGLFQQANGGTLFLDEIGEMPIEMQPKLLRALQERKVRPVGGNQEVNFDVRIVAASNRDLETEVYEKRFREDLYYRINVVRVDVPPLRERGGDILLLAQHFVERFANRNSKRVRGISAGAADKLLGYEFPGNVRELENCIERAVALARFDQVTVEDLPEKIRDYQANRLVLSVDDPAELVSLDELERRYVLRVLSLVGGNKSRASEILGLDRRTLYRKLERYDKAKN